MGERKSRQRKSVKRWSQEKSVAGESAGVDGGEGLHSENTTTFEVVRDDFAGENWATDGDEWNCEFAKSLWVEAEWQREGWGDQEAAEGSNDGDGLQEERCWWETVHKNKWTVTTYSEIHFVKCL